MLKKFITILLILFSTSCVKNWYKPYGYRIFSKMPSGGTPGFNLGWIHGCESGLGTQFSPGIYMSFYGWSKDPDIASSNPDVNKIRQRYKKELKNINWNSEADIKKNFSDYNTIFWGAHAFCRHSMLQTAQMADMTPPLPGETRYDPAKHSIGNVWKLNARGDSRIGSGATSLW